MTEKRRSHPTAHHVAHGVAALVLATAWIAPAAAGAGTNGIGASDTALRQALDGHTLRTLDGRSFTLGSLQGGVVVVNFWATWCRSCQRELPALAALNAELSAHGGQVLAISIDQDPRNVKRFVREHRLTLPIAQDGPDGLARALDLRSVPLTMVLDRRGAVAFVASGGAPQGLEAAGARARELASSSPLQAEGSTP